MSERDEIVLSSEDEDSLSGLLEPEEYPNLAAVSTRRKGKKKLDDAPIPETPPKGQSAAESRKFAENQHEKFKNLRARYDAQANEMEHLRNQVAFLLDDKSQKAKQFNTSLRLVEGSKKEYATQVKTLTGQIKTYEKDARVVLEAELLKEQDKENKQRHDEEITRLNDEIMQLRAELKNKDTSIGKMESFALK
jgi:septal ring factor EnvC (AmiA/AmiB activator)